LLGTAGLPAGKTLAWPAMRLGLMAVAIVAEQLVDSRG
jgi:hypothetical protein